MDEIDENGDNYNNTDDDNYDTKLMAQMSSTYGGST